MISSSEFIKGYTKIIICSYLYKQRDYLYNIVKKILNDGRGYIKISNPSALMVMKELENDGLVSFSIEISDQNQARKYYELTNKGKDYYLKNVYDYKKSLYLLKGMMGEDDEK